MRKATDVLWLGKGKNGLDALKSWAITLCFAALAAGIAGVIAPSGNMEKVYKFAVSLFFLCCLLVPLFSLKKIDLNLNIAKTAQTQTADIQNTLRQQTLRQAEDNLADVIRQRCVKNGVTPVGVDVQLSTNGSSSYDISKVVILLSPNDKGRENDLQADLKQSMDINATFKEGER